MFASPQDLTRKQPAKSTTNSSVVSNEAQLTATSLSQQARAPVDDTSTFPLRYTADMIPRLERIYRGTQGLKKEETAAKVTELFKRHFSGSVFKKSTFYHHQSLYLRAPDAEQDLGLIKTFVSYGTVGSKGTWKRFRNEVNHKSFPKY